MVSGLSTSPKLLSRILSGDAKLIVIWENVGLGLLSLLIAIFDSLAVAIRFWLLALACLMLLNFIQKEES